MNERATTKTWNATATARLNQSWQGTVTGANLKEAKAVARAAARLTERWGSERWNVTLVRA